MALCKVPGSVGMHGGSGSRSWCLPADAALHSHSYAACDEVLCGVSGVAKGYWQPIRRA